MPPVPLYPNPPLPPQSTSSTIFYPSLVPQPQIHTANVAAVLQELGGVTRGLLQDWGVDASAPLPANARRLVLNRHLDRDFRLVR